MKIRNKIFFKIHSWLGISSGLLLFVICWSGTIAVFSHEIDRLLNPSIQATVQEKEIPWQAIYEVVRNKHPDYRIQNINAPIKPGYASEVLALDQNESTKRIYVDPLRAKIRGQTSYFNVQRFFRSFHMALFQPDFIHILGVPIGYFVVGIFGLVLLASVITGFIFYRKWRKGLFKLKISKGSRRLWSDTHKLIGLWSLWFGLLIGITGTWYLVEWWLPEPIYADRPILPDLDSSKFLSITSLLRKANAAYPELQITSIILSDYPKGSITFDGKVDAVLVRDRAAYIELDASNGSVITLERPANLSALNRWMEAVDFLHFGNFGGLAWKWLYFIFGLILSVLCLTGAYLQSRRQKLKLGIKQYRKSILIAYTLTVALLLMATWAGFAEIKNYGTNNEWSETTVPVVIFISAWVGSTLLALGIWIRHVK